MLDAGIFEAECADDSCNHKPVKDDAQVSSSLPGKGGRRFKSLTVQVDCETLLKEMMEQAGEIVGMVVELTNQAWAEQQAAQAAAEEERIAAKENAADVAAKKDDEPAVSEKKRKAQPPAEEPEGSRSPKLGAKTVSEVSFHPPVKEVTTTTTAAPSFLESQILAFPMAAAVAVAARDADEESSNPSISAEKARHIIDYVFDEIDDAGFIPASVPSPSKKPRIES